MGHLISTTNFYGVQAAWEKIELYRTPAGAIEYSDWAILRWSLSRMTMTDYKLLKAHQGTSISSITTVGIDDRNSFTAYTDGAYLDTVVNSLHSGLTTRDTQISFKVKVT